MIIITHERTMKTDVMVQNVRRSPSKQAARRQAIRGVRLQTEPTVDTEKYFIALYEIKIDMQV